PHRLAGQLHDPETGLSYHRFRYYSPELGRYLEEDPAGTGGGLNLYAYTSCPLVQFDPRGLAVCTECEAGTCTREDHVPKKSPRPADTPPRAKDQQYPSDWKKFDPAYHEAFKKRLREFRGNDNLKYDYFGGEGRIFKGRDKTMALKRWYQSRLGDMKRSLERLEHARADVEANPQLSRDIEVVKIHEKGADWILRDFDPKSLELKKAGPEAQAARRRAMAALEDLRKQGRLTPDLNDLLGKLRSQPPSANLHWSDTKGKILVIDMQ
ncbi:MAG TPA: RHS repeat-associated core domain-containing protein, partial [Nannocystis sp.]